MMELSISPLKSVGQIDFGMTPSEVSALVGSEPKVFKRTPQDPFPSDYFESEGAFFYYDSDGRLEAAEFAQPAQPTVNNLALLGLSFDKAIAALLLLDTQLEKEADSAISYQLGVSIYAPLAKDDTSAPVETLVAFRSGYYD